MAVKEAGSGRDSRRGERLLIILETTRRELKKVLPPDLSNRELALVALGIRQTQIRILSDENRGLGHFVHFAQIRQAMVDLQILLDRIS